MASVKICETCKKYTNTNPMTRKMGNFCLKFMWSLDRVKADKTTKNRQFPKMTKVPDHCYESKT